MKKQVKLNVQRLMSLFKKRSVPSYLADQLVVEKLEEQYPEMGYCYSNGIYLTGDGFFAIISSSGLLYKVRFTVMSNDTVEIDSIEDVKMEFIPVSRSMSKVFRQADGKVRYLRVVATSVLNNAGEIDTRSLYDSFIAHAQESGTYPVRRLYHLPSDQFVVGQADFLAREGNVYVESGLFDTGESDSFKEALVTRLIEAVEDDKEIWGDSIGFLATKMERIKSAEGVEIDTFTEGIHVETSFLLESDACNLFTGTANLIQKDREMNKKEKQALEKLFGDESEDILNKFETELDDINRKIDEDGLITREADKSAKEKKELPGAEKSNPETVEDVPQTDATQRKDDAKKIPPVTDVEIDDSIIDIIVGRVITELGKTESGVERSKVIEDIQSQFRTLEDTYNEESGVLVKQVSDLTDSIAGLKTSIAAFTKKDDEKKREWLDDVPKPKQVKVTHRPTKRESKDDVEASYSSRADETLSNLK